MKDFFMCGTTTYTDGVNIYDVHSYWDPYGNPGKIVLKRIKGGE